MSSLEEKDVSCLEGKCAVELVETLALGTVVVGSVAQVGCVSFDARSIRLRSNDLLGQKSIQEASQVKLLGKVRPFAEGLIEQTLGGFDEGRLGVRKIGGDDWTVAPSNMKILEIVNLHLGQNAVIFVDGVQTCHFNSDDKCRTLVESNVVNVFDQRRHCDDLRTQVFCRKGDNV